MKLKIVKMKRVQSTNNIAFKLIKNKKLKPTLITSLVQTHGRGTMGKKWISKKGNLFITIFFKINQQKINFKQYALLNAYLFKNIIKKFTKNKIDIKWPNDLLVEKKKICGILQEVVEYNNEKFLITGIGINTVIAPHNDKFISTCLNNHSKRIIKNLKIIKNIKNAYEKMINDLNNNNFTYIKNKYI